MVAVDDQLTLVQVAVHEHRLSFRGFVERLLQSFVEPGEPVGRVSFDGVTHTVERIVDPGRLAAISARVASDDVLIADGHHRYGVALTYRDEVRSATGSTG